uniref:Uncharacterized protein n=1 Tax=Avena sativa TaxID=4498 RepID=A0ACD5ZE32_AVESA
MASSATVALQRELAPGPGAGISAAALAECCAVLLRPAGSGGGGGGDAARSALDALCAAGGEAVRPHADELTPLVVGRLGDGDAAVREAARRFLLLLMEMKEMNARLENIETPSSIPDVQHNICMATETESSDTNQVRKSLKQKISTRDVSLLAGEGDITRKSVEPIKVFSEKDLIKEIGKVTSILQPDNDWSIRITAMQRVEGIVLGGAADYSAFPVLLKQLVTPLINQLLDRRSTVVKQACHLLIFLSRELLRDFEPCAELLIPALLKNVVITVLVIAESADNCIKEMLQNCKVARILPKIIEFAKNDRSAVLRGRCCEYAILMLEYWVDTPELQRSANLYEDLIKCCIADATSEVRSGARACYRVFSRIWPERSHQLFSSFEPSRQKMINDDDAEINQNQLSCIERVSTAMDKVVKVDSGTTFSSGDLQLAPVKISLQHDDMTIESQAEDSKDRTLATGSSFEDRRTSGKEIISDQDPDKCDSGTSSSSCYLPSDTAFEPNPDILLSEATVETTFQDKAECRPNVEQIISHQLQASGDPCPRLSLSPSVNLEDSGNPVKARSNGSSDGKLRTQQVERHLVGTPRKGVHKESKNNHTPNFRRPLLEVLCSFVYICWQRCHRIPVLFQNLHQMSSSVLEMLDDSNESTRELALSLLVEILEKQEKALENCIETLVVKLLHATKDDVLKVVNQAHICLTTVVTQFDPLRCLRAIASQLVSHDEKILIVSINSLSKLVTHLSQNDLMTHLSTFLPALLDALENQSPYVRKAILLCVVDVYMKLGPTLLPHLERLDGAQLQLVVTTAHSRKRSIGTGKD